MPIAPLRAAMADHVSCVLAFRRPPQITQAVVRWISIPMSALLSIRARANERFQDQAMDRFPI